METVDIISELGLVTALEPVFRDLDKATTNLRSRSHSSTPDRERFRVVFLRSGDDRP